MLGADHVGASTGVSPLRKQRRGAKSNPVTTRGLVPVLSPDSGSAAAASCSLAGPVEQRQRCVHDEVGGIYFTVRAVLRFSVRARGTCAVDAVVSTAMRQTGENWQD